MIYWQIVEERVLEIMDCEVTQYENQRPESPTDRYIRDAIYADFMGWA